MIATAGWGKALDEIVFVVEEASEGGYIARASDESIFTEADDLEGLDKQMRDAVDCHFGDREMLPAIRWIVKRPAKAPGED